MKSTPGGKDERGAKSTKLEFESEKSTLFHLVSFELRVLIKDFILRERCKLRYLPLPEIGLVTAPSMSEIEKCMVNI